MFRRAPYTLSLVKDICSRRKPIHSALMCLCSQVTKYKYQDDEKEKILNILNTTDAQEFQRYGLKKILSLCWVPIFYVTDFNWSHSDGKEWWDCALTPSVKYNISKTRIKKFLQWRKSNGNVQMLNDLKKIEGFSEKITHKLFDSILNEDTDLDASNKIMISRLGTILQPSLSDKDRKNCKSVLAIYTTSMSVSWALIDKDSYTLNEWKYYSIDYKNQKKMLITDILDVAWNITNQLPTADVYVTKAEATSLRAAGSDPNNPKVLTVNLQRSQLVAILVALVNARKNLCGSLHEDDDETSSAIKQCVYFLRPTLPFRLYGTLVGNEKVSTEQTIEMLLQDIKNKNNNDNLYVSIPENLQKVFKSKSDLEKDMLGHCLLLALTFMDLCIYRNAKKLNKLFKD